MYTFLLVKKNGTLYVGVTNDIRKRIHEQKNSTDDNFVTRYGVRSLVYLEETNDVNEAIRREKQLKNWKREWKIELIEKNNPEWRDLFSEL